MNEIENQIQIVVEGLDIIIIRDIHAYSVCLFMIFHRRSINKNPTYNLTDDNYNC